MPNGSASSLRLARLVAVLGGLLFAGSLLFFVGSFVWRFERTAGPGPAWIAILANVTLFSAFALHHTVTARPRIKSLITRRVPESLERSLYVWVSSLLFIAVCWWWQPVPGVLWSTRGVGRALLTTAQTAAAIFTVYSAKSLDVLELAGVRQVFSGSLEPTRPQSASLVDRGPYELVRHPVYLGWFLVVWLAPTMNGTRLVFAIISCAYLVLAVPFEERDLRRRFGAAYDRYQESVKWRILPFVY